VIQEVIFNPQIIFSCLTRKRLKKVLPTDQKKTKLELLLHESNRVIKMGNSLDKERKGTESTTTVLPPFQYIPGERE